MIIDLILLKDYSKHPEIRIFILIWQNSGSVKSVGNDVLGIIVHSGKYRNDDMEI